VPDIIINNDSGIDWLTPAATLLAVVLGGLVTYWAQHVLNRRREKGEAKAAARVIQGDLAMAAGHLALMVQHDRTWYSFQALTLANWDERQAVLALHLKPKPWETVSQSALELRGTTEGWSRATAPGGPREGQHTIPLTEGQLAGLRKMWANASEAHRALAELAGTEPEQGLLNQGAQAPGN
jgi:hypothetical protein